MKRKKAKKSRSKRRAEQRARPTSRKRVVTAGEARSAGSAAAIGEALEQHKAGRLDAAEAGYRAVLEREPDNPDANNLLGMLALDTGHVADSVVLFERAVRADASVAAYHLNLGNALMAGKRLDDAARAFRRATDLGQGIVAAPYNLGLLHLERQDPEAAAAAFDEALAVDPAHARARFLATALSGGHCDSAPPEYVAELFDHYADDFEAHLREVLDYRIPEELRDLVLNAVGAEPAAWTILDLGCGSGVCGPLFRPYAARLIGSDLSPRILDKARATGAYDELHVEDLIDTLAHADREVDLVLAADVFVYVGDLDPVFAACAGAARPGGLFAFSTETCAGDRYRLRETCRYAHSPAYVREVAARHGFSEVFTNETVIRTQDKLPIPGHAFLFRRQARALHVSIAEAIAEALEHHRAGRLPAAEAGYRAVLRREPDNPDANNLLGMLALDTGYAEDAVNLLEKAVAASPDTAAYRLNLGNAQLATGATARAAKTYARAIELDGGLLGAHFNLGLLHMLDGRDENALECLRAATQIAPAHAPSEYLVAALTGESRATAPVEYVEMLFDTYASQFDHHLAHLEYDVPERLRALVEACVETRGAGWTVVDIGCGTGLSGAAFNDLAHRLVGCDLSAQMLSLAARRQIYDELRQEGLVEVLSGCSEEVDLVIAADVFIYVGALEETFAACRRALRRGGLLTFSVEDDNGEGFTLRPTGRFAHSDGYLRRLCEEHQFEVVGVEAASIRKDADGQIPGHVYAVRAG